MLRGDGKRQSRTSLGLREPPEALRDFSHHAEAVPLRGDSRRTSFSARRLEVDGTLVSKRVL